MQWSRRLALLLLCAAVAACSDSTGPPRTPAEVLIEDGNEQEAVVGTELPEPIVVRLVDDRGRPVADRLVKFQPVSGGGSVLASEVTTDQDGVAQDRWRLGTSTLEEQVLQATVVDTETGEEIVSALITATALPGAPTQLTVAGDPQSGQAGVALPDSIRVTVRDQFGNAVPGVQVSWSISSGGGAASPASTATGANGHASTEWTLGPTVGTQTMTANSVELSVVISATASAGSATTIDVLPANVTLGIDGDTVFTATVRDAFGNPVPNAPVTWSTSNSSVAEFDGMGRVTARAVGEVDIIAQSGTAVGSAQLTVDQRLNGWTSTQRPEYAFWGVGGVAGEALYGVGPDGLIARIEATDWTRATAVTTADLFGVWGAGAGNVFAVGEAGTILQLQGSSWAPIASGSTSTLRAVHGSGASHAVAVGDGGSIVQFDGSVWTTQTSGTAADLLDVWSVSPTEVYAVGEAGTILRFQGTGWSPMASGTTETILDVTGTDEGLIAVSAGGRVLRLAAGTWTQVGSAAPASLGAFIDAWGTSPSNIYAINNEVDPNLGGIYYFDGSTWEHIHTEGAATPLSNRLVTSVWGYSPDDVLVSGYRSVGPVGMILTGQR